MKKILVLMAIIAAIIFAFSVLHGIALIVFLLVLFPLIFFYVPLLFKDDKEELTEEAKKEQSGKFSKWD